MAIVSDSLIYDLAIGLIFFTICLYLYFTSTFNYWKDRGVAYIQPVPVFGSIKDMMLQRKGQGEMFKDFYNKMKEQRFFGYFEIKAPVLMIRDPNLVQQILLKDFNHFYNRGFPADKELDPLSANLFNLENHQWRNLRYKLTPTFTTGKLQGMFEQLCNCGEGLIKSIEEESKVNKAVESKSLLTNFTLEVIGSVAFGLQLNKENEASKSFRKVTEVVFNLNASQLLRAFALLLAPKLTRSIGIKQFPQFAEDIVMKLVLETLQYRKDNNIIRNDFLQLLTNLQKQEKDGTWQFQKDIDHHPEDDVINQMMHVSTVEEQDPLPEKQKAFMTDATIAAQSFVFLTAGSESVASTMNYALFSLAQNDNIQKNIHKEIDSVLERHKNDWSYQSVKEMVYLEQVIQETLRLYPSAPTIFRICTKPYKVPDSDLVIEKGVRVVIPVMSMHRDPQNYENPEVFDPDRFKDNNFKPSGKYLPFGDGPRICIAEKCKKRWTQIRENYRRAKMRGDKTTTGQAATKRKQYKFEKELSFLNDFISDQRRQIGNVIDSSASDTTTEKEQNNEPEANINNLFTEDTYSQTATHSTAPVAPVLSPVLTPSPSWSPASQSPSPAADISTTKTASRYGRKAQKSPIAEYFKCKKEMQESKLCSSTIPTTTVNDKICQNFFKQWKSVRGFPPYLQVEAKTRISTIVLQLEAQTVQVNNPTPPEYLQYQQLSGYTQQVPSPGQFAGGYYQAGNSGDTSCNPVPSNPYIVPPSTQNYGRQNENYSVGVDSPANVGCSQDPSPSVVNK